MQNLYRNDFDWVLQIGHWVLGIGQQSIVLLSLAPPALLAPPAPPASPAPSSPISYATNPERKALTAAWVRSSAHNLFKILRTWVFTVPTVM